MADFIRVDAHVHLYRTPEEAMQKKQATKSGNMERRLMFISPIVLGPLMNCYCRCALHRSAKQSS